MHLVVVECERAAIFARMKIAKIVVLETEPEKSLVGRRRVRNITF